MSNVPEAPTQPLLSPMSPVAFPPTPPAPASEPPSLIPPPAAPAPDAVASSPHFHQAPGQGDPNPYRLVFPDIAACFSSLQWADLVHTAEMADLNKSGREADLSRMLVIGPLVLAYLILDDLPPARFALIRLPHDLASRLLPQALFNLLASTTDRKYANVYRHANELLDVLTLDPTASGVDVELSVVLRSMLDKFLDAFRMHTFDLLRRTYTAIQLEKVQGFLGLEADVVLQAAKNLGQWAYDANTQLLTPLTQSSSSSTDPSASDVMTFHAVAGTAVHLESSV